MNLVELQHRLMALERRLQRHEQMRADPRTGLVVTWNNSVPTIYGQAIVQIPVSITGWTSGCGTYAWQEDSFGFSGERVMSGSLFGGSGAYSGSNLMVEMNGNIIASGSFPVHTRAWRRSYTMPSQDVWEFQWQSGGSAGGSGTALNAISLGSSGQIISSGITTLSVQYANFTPSGSATLVPQFAGSGVVGVLSTAAGIQRMGAGSKSTEGALIAGTNLIWGNGTIATFDSGNVPTGDSWGLNGQQDAGAGSGGITTMYMYNFVASGFYGNFGPNGNSWQEVMRISRNGTGPGANADGNTTVLFNPITDTNSVGLVVSGVGSYVGVPDTIGTSGHFRVGAQQGGTRDVLLPGLSGGTSTISFVGGIYTGFIPG